MNGAYLDKLLYRRQFLISPTKINNFSYPDWSEIFLGRDFWLYAHPDLPVAQVTDGDLRLSLVGYFINPYRINENDEHILSVLLRDVVSGRDIFHSSEPLGGRWVLVISSSTKMFLFNDACGLRQVYYLVDSKKRVWCTSQPALLAEHVNLEVDKKIAREFVSKVFPRDREYWWPGNLSLYVNMKKLLPNHFLELTEIKVSRFWPCSPLTNVGLEESVRETSFLLKRTLRSACSRYALAVGITAGLDSRCILAASRGIEDRLYFYTTVSSANSISCADVLVPERILQKLGLKHNLIDCHESIDARFLETYNRSSFLAHRFWRDVAYGMFQTYPQDRVSVRGNCSEIARCFYYQYGYYKSKKVTAPYLSSFAWGRNDIAVAIIEDWLKEAREVEANFNINLLDLFYWEHRMGSWQATLQHEWDIVHESFLPFNSRLILCNLLSVASKYRIAPDYILYKRIIQNLWPTLLAEPINPRTELQKLLTPFGRWLRKAGVYYYAKAWFRPRSHQTFNID